MATSHVTPEVFYEKLLTGFYKRAADAKKAIGRCKTKWNKAALERGMSHIARYFEKGKEAMPPSFYPTAGPRTGEIASDKKVGKKSKKTVNSEAFALPADPSSSALAAEVMADDQQEFMRDLYGPSTGTVLAYLSTVVNLHSDVIDAFGKAKDVDQNVDTSEVQGVVNSLSQVASLVMQESQRGLGVLLKRLPAMRTPVNNGVIVTATEPRFMWKYQHTRPLPWSMMT